MKSDVTGAGYTQSSTGGNHNPDIGDQDVSAGDDGIPGGSYVVSQPFAATLNGQTTPDTGDPKGYDDASSYMTVDFGFLNDSDVQNGAPNAVTLSALSVSDSSYAWALGLLLIGLVGVAAFIWRRRRAM